MEKAKVLFYHWDWKEQPEAVHIDRAVQLVFDGKNCPRIYDEIPTADWDQQTLAIVSSEATAVQIGEQFIVYLEAGMAYWWDGKKNPIPLEI